MSQTTIYTVALSANKIVSVVGREVESKQAYSVQESSEILVKENISIAEGVNYYLSMKGVIIGQ